MTNDETIYSTTIADGMPPVLAALIVAQARHETGNYTSRFFTQGNNAFGYSYVNGAKYQLQQPGPTADNGQPIAQYANIQNSVHEITAWIKRRQNQGLFPGDLTTINTPDEYATLLKKAGYFGAPLAVYTNGLIHWLSQISVSTYQKGGIAVLLILALGLLLFRKRIFK